MLTATAHLSRRRYRPLDALTGRHRRRLCRRRHPRGRLARDPPVRLVARRRAGRRPGRQWGSSPVSSWGPLRPVAQSWNAVASSDMSAKSSFSPLSGWRDARRMGEAKTGKHQLVNASKLTATSSAAGGDGYRPAIYRYVRGVPLAARRDSSGKRTGRRSRTPAAWVSSSHTPWSSFHAPASGTPPRSGPRSTSTRCRLPGSRPPATACRGNTFPELNYIYYGAG